MGVEAIVFFFPPKPPNPKDIICGKTNTAPSLDGATCVKCLQHNEYAENPWPDDFVCTGCRMWEEALRG